MIGNAVIKSLELIEAKWRRREDDPTGEYDRSYDRQLDRQVDDSIDRQIRAAVSDDDNDHDSHHENHNSGRTADANPLDDRAHSDIKWRHSGWTTRGRKFLHALQRRRLS